MRKTTGEREEIRQPQRVRERRKHSQQRCYSRSGVNFNEIIAQIPFNLLSCGA
jgi:hypothetical protein